MAAGGLDPYDDDDIVLVPIQLRITRAELNVLNRMKHAAGTNRSQVVTAIMRDVIADEMAEQGAEKGAEKAA